MDTNQQLCVKVCMLLVWSALMLRAFVLVGADDEENHVVAYWERKLPGAIPSSIRAMVTPLSSQQATQLLINITAMNRSFPNHALSFCKAARIKCIQDIPSLKPTSIDVPHQKDFKEPSSKNLIPFYHSHDPSSKNLIPFYQSHDPSFQNVISFYHSDNPSSKNAIPFYQLDTSSSKNAISFYQSDDSSSKNAIPFYQSDDPSSKNVIPIFHSDNPSSKNAIPFYHSDDPSSKNAIPFYQSDDQSSENVISFYQPNDQSSKNAIPFYQSNDLSSKNVIPFYQSDHPSSENAISFYQFDAASSKNAIPFYQSNALSSRNDISFYQPDDPSSKNAIPFYQTDNPSSKNAIPFYQTDDPSIKSAIPFYQSDDQSSRNAIPFYQSDDPSSKNAIPFYHSNDPSSINLIPLYHSDELSSRNLVPNDPSSKNIISFYQSDDPSSKNLIPFYHSDDLSFIKNDESSEKPNKVRSQALHRISSRFTEGRRFLSRSPSVHEVRNAFREKQVLVSGKKIYIGLASDDRHGVDERAFLPRKLARLFPLDNEGSKIENMLQISKESLLQTIHTCEAQSKNDYLHAEVKACLTSLEDVVDFVTNIMGSSKPIKVYDSLFNASSVKFVGKTFTVLKVESLKQDPDEPSISCHDMDFPFRMFYCHYAKHTKSFAATLQAEDGSIHERIANCHYDTSYWNPQHVAFQDLHSKPGEGEICHWLGRTWMEEDGWLFLHVA